MAGAGSTAHAATGEEEEEEEEGEEEEAAGADGIGAAELAGGREEVDSVEAAAAARGWDM